MERSTGQRYEEEITEQPVDYSKKYSERKTENSARPDRSCKKEFGERDSKVDLFGDYAETDLDQPTDYSLRYAEDDTDDDEKQSPEYFPGSVQEDTVKTYCTEGTPYETPFNFSTATSMSDLRLEDAKESVDPQKKLNKKILDLNHKEDLNYEHTMPINCNEDRSLLVEKELGTSKASESCKSNCLSNEKLINYYQAGTSGGFSRAPSLSSLGSAIAQRNNATGIISKPPSTDSSDKADNVSERADRTVVRISDENDSSTESKNNSRVVDKEGKMVTFSRQDYYAEQTPLMFSRCSSLGSLSGFEQHSIHDDRSSIISDFSRRTSGIVSPSELPDSPTQTIPPSPRNHKSQCADFISKIPEEAVRPPVRHLSYSKCHVPRTSVFEDDIATFKEESTPIEFSTATSLSSLTIDDEMKIPKMNIPKPQNELKKPSNELDKDIKENSSEEKVNNVEIEKDQEQVSDGDEDDEDMLAACISMGIQNNRYRQSFKSSSVQKPVQSESSNILVRCQRTPVLNRLDPSVPISVDTPVNTSKSNKSAIEVAAAPDTVHVYCTEDTPADISPVGSQSNLSALSMPSVQEDVERIEEAKSSTGAVECHRNDLSDESSNLSGEDEKILDECIQSGIPKVRQITPPPTSCIPFVQKTEVLSQRFNICGTPSSSPVESGNKNSILRKPMCRATLEHENDLFDDSPNHSDDEAILSECIRAAIPKVKLNISTLIGALPQIAEKSKITPPRKLSLCTPYRQSEYTEDNKDQSKKSVSFEDNLSLSEEEEDIMLAQCIKSGMPKALNVSSNSSLLSVKKQLEYPKTRNIASTSSYYVNKPCLIRNPTLQAQPLHKSVESDFSLQGGTSCTFHPAKVQESRRHIVKNGGISTYERTNPVPSYTRKFLHSEHEHNSMNENILNTSRSEIPNCRSPVLNVENDDDEPCRSITKSNIVPSRHSSVSSLSEEGSLGSIEEWALLELCISSGMPRNKYRLKGMKNTEGNVNEDCDTIAEDNYSICSYNSYVCKT